MGSPGSIEKLRWSIPWLIQYPLWRCRTGIRRLVEGNGPRHLILVIANHFEPSWNEQGAPMAWDVQQARLDRWCEQARRIGIAVRDSDGVPFRHTYFYPAEQYYPPLLDRLAELQRDGFGEVEIHLHHGVSEPDTPGSLRQTLVDFRDALAERHHCLSRMDGSGPPMYAFVHGNWALANSAGGRYCGVDGEMEILAETGCYADFTLPSAPDRSQVPRINAIYQCGRPMHERCPHRTGPELRVGERAALPILVTGPLVLDWRRWKYGISLPKLDNGALITNYPVNQERFQRWIDARIGVRGRPEWVFVKLYCHGFFDGDAPQMIGEAMRQFLTDLLDLADRSGQFQVHFATARETFNMIQAAIDGRQGNPGSYRNYRLHPIVNQVVPSR